MSKIVLFYASIGVFITALTLGKGTQTNDKPYNFPNMHRGYPFKYLTVLYGTDCHKDDAASLKNAVTYGKCDHDISPLALMGNVMIWSGAMYSALYAFSKVGSR